MARGNTRAVGQIAEQEALDFLIRRGLRKVGSNFRCRHGEIDLIMRDQACLVFTEVRYRAGRRLASASATIDLTKQRKLIRTAAIYLACHSRHAGLPVRFDVIAIDVNAAGRKSINWIRDAFRPADSTL